MSVMSVRLNDETTAQLDTLAKATGHTRSFLAISVGELMHRPLSLGDSRVA
ncbi:hypothetical protein PEC106568_28060 [Pectobacterium carotovorum subsp. carotovorum]|nr:hypothetical protein PEC106568_28060 [Pectobacterium carotovorum subsp. carotovorum]